MIIFLTFTFNDRKLLQSLLIIPFQKAKVYLPKFILLNNSLIFELNLPQNIEGSINITHLSRIDFRHEYVVMRLFLLR